MNNNINYNNNMNNMMNNNIMNNNNMNNLNNYMSYNMINNMNNNMYNNMINNMNNIMQNNIMNSYMNQMMMNQCLNQMNLNINDLNNNNINNDNIQPLQNNQNLNVNFRKGSKDNYIIQCLANEKISEIIQKYQAKAHDYDKANKFIFNAKDLNPNKTAKESYFNDLCVIHVINTKGLKEA